MDKPRSTGLLVYAVVVSALLLILFAEFRSKASLAKRATGNLYSVCRSLQAVAPSLLEFPPMATTPVELEAQFKDAALQHRRGIYQSCNDDYLGDAFYELQERELRNRK
jgi:hypothetical protein